MNSSNTDIIEERKKAIMAALISKVDEDVAEESVPLPSMKPQTEDRFKRSGITVGGSFARTKKDAQTVKQDVVVGPRYGTQKIWEDRPIKNI